MSVRVSLPGMLRLIQVESLRRVHNVGFLWGFNVHNVGFFYVLHLTNHIFVSVFQYDE